MAGYTNGSQIYWNNRGYAEGYIKLPMSSHNVKYITGYRDAGDDRANFGNIGGLPAYTNDNYRDFYLGMYQGAVHTDEQLDRSGIGQWSTICPLGATTEYCAGYRFGADSEGYIRDVP
jgi:hypothetical protein